MNLLPVLLVAIEGYYSKFTIFTGATTSKKMQIWGISKLCAQKILS